MAVWDFKESGSVERQISEYGSYAVKPPAKTWNLTTKAMSRSDLDTEIAKYTGTTTDTISYTCCGGETVTGVPKSINWKQIPGAAYYEVNVSLQEVDSTPAWVWELAGSVDRPDVTNMSAHVTDPPDESWTVTARNAPYSEVTSQVNAARGGITTGTYTIAGSVGSITGTIKGVSYTQVEGTALFNITVTLKKVESSIVWEWVGSGQAARNLVIAKSISGATADRYYAYESGTTTYSITARNAPMSQVTTQLGYVNTIGTTQQTYTMADETTVTGIPIAISWRGQGSDGLYEITMTIQGVNS